MSTRMNVLMVFLLTAFIILMSSIFAVNEGQQALLMRLGKLVVDEQGVPKTYNPGLHFKWPIINQVRLFDVRLQTLEMKASRIVTKEKKDVIVDSYVKWRIENLPLYYTRTSGVKFDAENLLEQKITTGLRAEFGRKTIRNLVSDDREDTMKQVKTYVDNSAEQLGINVIDARVKRIDLPTEVSKSVFSRMRAEREKIANEHRAQGKSDAEAIQANADKEVTVLLATMHKKAKEIRATGDRKAAEIYAKNFQQSPEFYAFYRSLLAYTNAFSGKQDILVLKPDSEFFKYLKKSNQS